MNLERMLHAALREEALVANQQLGASGLVDLTFGNASVFDPAAGVFAIKPSGVAYAELSAANMVLVDMDGQVLEGSFRPSSDAPTHRRLFEAFAGVHSVVHTHSRFASSFAQALKAIPCLGTTHADYFCGPVPVTRLLTPAEISGAYEWNTGNAIVEALAGIDPLAMPAVLVARHAPFVWGSTSVRTVETARALEIVAQLAFQTLMLAPDCAGTEPGLLEKHFSRKHGPTAYYGQSSSRKA